MAENNEELVKEIPGYMTLDGRTFTNKNDAIVHGLTRDLKIRVRAVLNMSTTTTGCPLTTWLMGSWQTGRYSQSYSVPMKIT